MAKKEKRKHNEKSLVTETMLKSETMSLKDHPADETVCSPYFSQGCINEETDLSTIVDEEDEHEKH